jgi:hypothetical protein
MDKFKGKVIKGVELENRTDKDALKFLFESGDGIMIVPKKFDGELSFILGVPPEWIDIK